MDDVGNATVTLTVDSIVEKYRSRGSEATLVANLRRQGLSATAIKRAVEDRRARVGTAAEQEEQVERFRADLIVQSRAEQITRLTCSGRFF
jgi:hypothetical protein